MAATSSPLVWDFYTQISDTGLPGVTVHYFDTCMQDIYFDNGLQTNVGEVPEGHWRDIDGMTAYDVDDHTYGDTDFDHPYNGALFGSAIVDGELQFLRYIYLADCTELIRSGTIDLQGDSDVVSMKTTLEQVSPEFYLGELSLFQPGAKVTVRARVGAQTPYSMGVFYIDSFDYKYMAQTVSISARNTIGARLMESTFDTETTIEGYPQTVLAWILGLAGITKYHIQEGTWYTYWTFKPEQTLYDGIQQVIDYYMAYKMIELPDGSIAIGYPWWISSYYQGNGYYVIDKDKIFSRSIKQSSDAAYAQVMATGQDENGVDFIPIILPVNNFSAWALPSHKTYHVEAPKGYDQQQFEDYAASVAESLQQVGVTESISAIFIPQLLPGDIMSLNDGDETATTLGIVTSIRHKFGKTGYFTDFTTDSGGVVTDEHSQTVTVTRSVEGYNRKQTLKDLIQIVAKK